MISSDRPPSTSAGGGGCLRFGCLGIVVVCLLGLVFISTWRPFGEEKAVPAPVRWVTRDVVLDGRGPIAEGTLSLRLPSGSGGTIDTGVSAGVPRPFARPAATGAPALLLTAPAVRLRATTATGFDDSCIAPCELQLGYSGCSGDCVERYTITLDLIGPPGPLADGSVSVPVAGGLSAQLDSQLPGDTMVDLAFPAPSGSGG